MPRLSCLAWPGITGHLLWLIDCPGLAMRSRFKTDTTVILVQGSTLLHAEPLSNAKRFIGKSQGESRG
jgi:uncharacterized lipoprotein NlpE involved in copper resistance